MSFTQTNFDWAEYLSVAETICGQVVTGPTIGAEANRRAGVSRAYYAAFALARNRLRDVDGVQIPLGGIVHQFVANQYANHTDTRRVQIGIELRRLRNARNKCDYDDMVPGLSNLTRRSLARSAQIIADLKRL